MTIPVRFGDLPEHGLYACRLRRQIDHWVGCYYGRRHRQKAVRKWLNKAQRLYDKLWDEILRQQPKQIGWEKP